MHGVELDNVYSYVDGSKAASYFFFNVTATTEIYTLSLHDALPISGGRHEALGQGAVESRHVRYRNFWRPVAGHQGHSQPRRCRDPGRGILPDDRPLRRGWVRLRPAVLDLQPRLPQLGRRLLERQTEHPRNDLVPVQNRRRKDDQVRREVPGDERRDEGAAPQLGAASVEPGHMPLADRGEMAAEAHQRTRRRR